MVAKKDYLYALDCIQKISNASFLMHYEFKVDASDIDETVLEHLDDISAYAEYEEIFDTTEICFVLEEIQVYFDKFKENWNADKMTVCDYKPVMDLYKNLKKAIKTAKKV